MIQSEHPLHLSVFTSMAPFIFAIFILFNALICHKIGCKDNNKIGNNQKKTAFSFGTLKNKKLHRADSSETDISACLHVGTTLLYKIQVFLSLCGFRDYIYSSIPSTNYFSLTAPRFGPSGLEYGSAVGTSTSTPHSRYSFWPMPPHWAMPYASRRQTAASLQRSRQHASLAEAADDCLPPRCSMRSCQECQLHKDKAYNMHKWYRVS